MSEATKETLAELREELADRVMRIAAIRAERDALARELSYHQREVMRLKSHIAAVEKELKA